MRSFHDTPELGEYVGKIQHEIKKMEGYPFSCGLIAIDIAKILRDSTDDIEDLTVVDLRGKGAENSSVRPPLVPKRFGGVVKWGAHLICVGDETAFDPILDEPAPFDAYMDETFTAKPDVFQTFEGLELEELIARRSLVEQIISKNAPTDVIAQPPAQS
ncbi:MAG TPA: hypothetical protein VFK11_03500 [Candidatus Saccharimonadales bacterium]|nr:hypothetical protein [Candidatus Saccharimonadales bacterium]